MASGVVDFGDGAEFVGQGVTKKGGHKTWKIAGKHYDLGGFLHRHPGGERILTLARDHFPDSTYAFESHHQDIPKAMAILKKFEVPTADVDIQSSSSTRQPVMCKEGSFFWTVKTRVHAHLQTTERGAGPDTQCLLLFGLLLAGWGLLFGLTLKTGSPVFSVLNGVCGAMLAGYGHNWAHQPKYHFWAWVLDLEGLISQNWFVSHVLTHHMYTNLPADNHFKILEPFLMTDPTRERHWINAEVMPHLTPIVFAVASFAAYLAATVQMVIGVNLDPHHPQHIGFYWSFPLVYLQLALLYAAQGAGWGFTLFMIKSAIVSEWYLVIAFINHNTAHAWSLRERKQAKDWGEAQLCASSDIGQNESFLSSARYLWLNYHTVHHLFPNTDMSKHPDIQKILVQTCKDFDIKYSVGRDLPELYAEMMQTFRTPRDLLCVMSELHM